MRFTLISDMHVDFGHWDWSSLQHCDPTIPMVVAGDIANDVFETSRWMADLRSRFPTVIWVMGNHDAYNSGFYRTRLTDPSFSARWPYPKFVAEIDEHYAEWSRAHDIHYLNSSEVEIGGVRFLGATGWHNFDADPNLRYEDQVDAWAQGMQDARHIRWLPTTTTDHRPVLEAAMDQADWLRNAVRANSDPKVIITHHVPHRSLVRFTTSPVWNLLNGSFLNSAMQDVPDDSVRAWCYGHTHFRGDVLVDGCRYINNARGYPRENPGWTPVEIEVS